MALIIEDGSGVAGADSYRDVADMVTYISERYVDDPFVALDAATQEIHARRAAGELDGEYEPRLQGSRVESDQSLAWPRNNVRYGVTGAAVPNDSVPTDVADAQTEVARRYAAGTEFAPDLERGGAVKREKVDVIEQEYFEKARSTTQFQQIDNLMAPYLYGGEGEFRLIRG